jgi:predicted RNase H-like nuclease
MKLIGIDGCPGGWVCASADAELSTATFTIHQDLTNVFSDAVRDGDRVVIDVPIGLPTDRPRECDVAARSYLPKGKKSSVFPAPCEVTLAAGTFGQACALNCQACGKAISKQLWGILPKIRDVDRLMSCARQSWIREAHPEVTFAALGGHASPLPKKRERAGQDKRLALIRSYVPSIDPSIDRAGLEERRRRLGAGKVSLDDLIDAIGCLITAYRIIKNTAFTLPPNPPKNARGLRMEIVA